MPDRPRRALPNIPRLLASRSRQKGHAVPVHIAPLDPAALSPSSAASDADIYLLPWESAQRANSLQPALPTGFALDARGCDSLPAAWRPPEPEPHEAEGAGRRERRAGIRFHAPVEEATCLCACRVASTLDNAVTEDPDDTDALSAPEQSEWHDALSMSDSSPIHAKQPQQEIPIAMVAELAALRAAQERQHALMEASLAAAAAQSARLEAALDALRAREARRRPGAAEVVLFGVLDALAALLLCAITWLVAKPCVGVWKIVKKCRGDKEREEVRRRRSWRLSGVDGFGSDPFLASAAKRLSFTAASLHD